MGLPGFIASIGFKAIAGNLVGKAASGVKGVGKWLGSLDLVHGLLLLAVIFGCYQTAGRWMQHRHAAKVEAQLSATMGQLTKVRADLATSKANEAGLRKAIGDQNAAIAQLSATSAAQQKTATAAENAASQRASEAEAVAQRLRAGTRSSGLKSDPASNCEPSDTLKQQWQS